MKFCIFSILLLLTGARVYGAAEPQCPQPRFTGQAPEPVYSQINPLEATRKHLRQARKLYRGKVHDEVKCAACHGKRGDGLGPLAARFSPPPRNFTCEATINGIPDGQLFWIIQQGSPGTAMPAHPNLTDRELWLLVLELRRLAR